jgi:DNA topoisomerase IA
MSGRDHLYADRRRADGPFSAISAARVAISERYNGHYLPEKPRHYETKAKNAQEAHEAIRPTDFGKDRFTAGRRGAAL